MADQKTAQQAVREQYKVVENVAESVVSAWSGLAATTATFTFENFEKGLRYSQEARMQADRLTNETLTDYRRIYQDSLQTWQNYIQRASEILTRLN